MILETLPVGPLRCNCTILGDEALTNFSRTLPPEGSDLAEQILKDPYQFDFLTLAPAAKERELVDRNS